MMTGQGVKALAGIILVGVLAPVGCRDRRPEKRQPPPTQESLEQNRALAVWPADHLRPMAELPGGGLQATAHLASGPGWRPPPFAGVPTTQDGSVHAAPATTLPATQGDVLPEPPPSPPAGTQPDGGVPIELDSLPPPSVGQFVLYSISSSGPQGRLRQTVESAGPGPNNMTVAEQTIVNGEVLGQRTLLLPRFGRRWPKPTRGEGRTVSYSREPIVLASRTLDCIVLTVESRSGGSARVEKQWICGTVPVSHLARLVVTHDGREVFRQEVVEFGGKP